MKNLPTTSVLLVGSVAILLAAAGLVYNAMTLYSAQSGAFADLVAQQGLSRFYQAFYTMSAICIACYLLLLLCGIALVRVRYHWSGILTGVLVFEVIYLLSIGLLWSRLSFGMSVAAATGVANGGIMFQFVVLFPVWAPLVLRRAKKRLAHGAPLS